MMSSKLFHGCLKSNMVWILLHFLLLIVPSLAQIGVTICACSPVQWKFTVNLNSTCRPEQLLPGTAAIHCDSLPTPPGPIVPKSVNVFVMELDQDRKIMSQAPVHGLDDGDSFTYRSVVNRGIAAPLSVPRAIQLMVTARTEMDGTIFRASILTFSNACADFPAATSES